MQGLNVSSLPCSFLVLSCYGICIHVLICVVSKHGHVWKLTMHNYIITHAVSEHSHTSTYMCMFIPVIPNLGPMSSYTFIVTQYMQHGYVSACTYMFICMKFLSTVIKLCIHIHWHVWGLWKLLLTSMYMHFMHIKPQSMVT